MTDSPPPDPGPAAEAPQRRPGGCQPRMAGCASTCLHRQNVEAYRETRAGDLARMETETALYPGDVEIWLQHNNVMTFKQWLMRPH